MEEMGRGQWRGQWEEQMNPALTTSPYSSRQLRAAEHPPPAIKTGTQMGKSTVCPGSLTFTGDPENEGR